MAVDVKDIIRSNLPIGPTGPIGPQGPTGPTGPIGLQGPTGPSIDTSSFARLDQSNNFNNNIQTNYLNNVIVLSNSSINLDLNDNSKSIVILNSLSNTSVTLNNATLVGYELTLIQQGNQQVSFFPGPGTSILAFNNIFTTNSENSYIKILVISPNLVYLFISSSSSIVNSNQFILDEAGEQILDENFQPILAENSIPLSSFILDEAGEQILDENFQPILAEIV